MESTNATLLENFFELYTKDEFDFIISLLPYFELIKPIKQHTKEFRKDIKGFRPDRMPEKKLFNIYYDRIYKRNDSTMKSYFKNLVGVLLLEIDKKISKEIDDKLIRDNIENNNMESFIKLTDLLITTPFRENINIYFKLIYHELNDDQNNYIRNELKEKITLIKLKNKVQNELSEVYENKVNDLERIHADELEIRDKLIKSLEEQQRNFQKQFKIDLKNKKLELENLQKHYEKTNKKLLLTIEDLTDRTNEQISLKEKLFNDIDDKDTKIKELSDLLELKYLEFNEIALEKWNESNKDLLQKSEEVKNSIELLNNVKKTIMSEVDMLKAQEDELRGKISNLENNANGFISNMRYILDNVGYKPMTTTQSEIFRISSTKLETEQYELMDKIDFIEDLQSNLEISGINNEYSWDLAQYIYAILANKMCVLLVGYDSRKVADAVSYTINGLSAEVIGIPAGYNNCQELMHMLNEINNRVILFENVIDNVSETVFIPLIKQKIDKFLFFSMESSENISIIPKSILHYMVIIDLDILIGFESDAEILNCSTDPCVFDININNISTRYNLRYLKDFDSILPFNNVTKLNIAKIMSIIDDLDSSNAMYDIIFFSIYLLCRCYDKVDALREFIKTYEFSTDILHKFQSVLGSDL